MKFHDEISALPFSLIAGQKLGVKQCDELLSSASRTFGQAKLKFAANVATGNLTAQDRLISIPDVNGTIDLSYVYNSLDSEWRLNAGRKIKLCQDATNGWYDWASSFVYSKTPTLTLLEADGSESSYILKEDGNYYAVDCQDGTPSIKHNKEKNTFTWSHPKTRVSEEYDAQGKILKKIDEVGNETHYEYDETGALKTIISPSGTRYEIRRSNQIIQLVLVAADKKEKLLHSYQFEQGKLKTSTTSDGYEINYQYDATGKLKQASQADGSVINFGYYATADANKNKLKTIQVGSDEFRQDVNVFSYESDSCTFTDAIGNKTHFKFDDKKKIKDIIQQEDVVHYEHTVSGQIEKLTYPDGSTEQFKYHDKTGLILKRINRDKTSIQYLYSEDKESQQPLLIAKLNYSAKDESKPLGMTRYVYDSSLLKNNKPVLRFEISPAGCVKEYTYTATGLIESFSEYQNKNDVYTLRDKIPTLTDMLSWKNEKERSSVCTKRYEYDTKGRITKEIDGNSLAESILEYDDLGRIICISKKLDSKKFLKTKYQYDDNGNIKEKIVGADTKIAQITRYQYKDNKVITTHPNGRIEIEEYDSRHLLNSYSATVPDEKVVRQSKVERDAAGRMIATIAPDGNRVLTGHDHQNRPTTQISPEGSVTKCSYSRQYRYQTKTEYATVVDVSAIKHPDDIDDFALTADDKNDRVSYTFFGTGDEVRFTVDAENYLIEHQYDDLGNEIRIIKYADKITDDELELLKTGKEISRIPERSNDQVTSYFYDQDGHKMGEQNSRGFVTRYERDAAGRITQEIHYATQCEKLSTRLEDVLPEEDKENDAHHYYFHDELGQCVLEVDAERYITTYSYCSDGQKQSSTRFEVKVDDKWLDKSIPPIPVVSQKDNDHTTTYLYDDLGRLEEVRETTGKITHYSYDEMNNRIETCVQDAREPLTQDNIGDLYRASEYKVDGWGRVVAEADPLVKEKLMKMSLSAASSVDKDKIWQEHAKRNQYNEVGLKLKSTDQLGHHTLYYYDKDGNLVLTIDPTGAVTENIFNAFKETVEKRHYYNRVAADELLLLTGGYISEAIRKKIITNPAKDVVTKLKRNRLGQIIEKTDPESYVSTFEYDAFSHCTHELLPGSNSSTLLSIKHKYDSGNNEVKTVTQTVTAPSLPEGKEDVSKAALITDYFSKDKEIKSISTQTTESPIVVEKKYEHFLNVATEVIDELGARTQLTPDKLGRIKKVEKEVAKDTFLTESETEYDSFSQKIKVIDANKNETRFEHEQKSGTTFIITPVLDAKETIKHNIFGETTEQTDPEGCKETFKHIADGQLAEHAVGDSKTSASYTLTGLKEEETNAAGVKTKYAYNAASQLTKKIEDADEHGLNITTQLTPNAFGQVEEEIDPRSVKSTSEFDRKGGLVTKISHAKDTQLITQYVRNPQGDEVSRVIGDEKNPDQMHIATEYDSLGHTTAKTTDPYTVSRSEALPPALDIRNEYVRDAAGNIIKVINPYGNAVTRSYFDFQKRKNFEIKNVDGTRSYLTEWSYTNTGKVAFTRSYHMPLDPKTISDATTLEDLKKISASPNVSDTITRYYYDAKDRERFTVSLYWDTDTKTYRGIVVEKIYDKADRVIKQISYAKSIDADKCLDWTTETLVSLLVATPEKDRVSSFKYDSKKQLRFSIAQNGLVTEKTYDKAGRVVQEIAYANPVTNWQDKTSDEISAEVQKNQNPKRDCTTFKLYDSLGREIFEVKPNGAVTRNEYDENNNIIQTCLFKNPVSTDCSYDELVEKVKSLQPLRTRDTITENEYNEFGYLIAKTDALGHQDIFERDILGHATKHVDRSGHATSFAFDRAGRMHEETSPLTKITIVERGPDGKHLVNRDLNTTIKKKIVYGKIDNVEKITDGIIEGATEEERLSQARVFRPSSDALGRLLDTRLSDVSIDTAEKKADLFALPTKTIDVVTTYIKDPHDNVLVEILENDTDASIFRAYDSLGRLIYVIDGEKAITQFSYDSFDKPTKIIQYATKITTDLKPYLRVGLTPDIIANNFPPQTSAEDRVEERDYDSSGRLKSVKSGPVLYYSDGKIGIAQPETKKEFNEFEDCVAESRLIRPGVWASKHTWFDKTDRVIATVDENNYLTRFDYNAAGKVRVRKEFAAALTQAISLSTTVDELDEFIKEASAEAIKTTGEEPEDRIYKYDYDARGLKISETIVGVVTENFVLDEKTGAPCLVSSVKTDLTKKWEYTASEKEACTIHEDGSKERKYYDERGIKIAETQVTRKSQDENGGEVSITPLTRFRANACGQIGLIQTTARGGQDPEATTSVPELIAPTADDVHEEMLQHDSRGLVKLKQDPDKNLTGFTYTAARKTAREMTELTNPRNISPPDQPAVFVNDTFVDEKQSQYDKCGCATKLTTLRDSKVEEETHSRFNAFGECDGESADGQHWESHKKMDTQGHAWFTNSSQGGSIKLHDLRGAETLQLQATDVDLSTVGYSEEQFKALLASDPSTLERTETDYDAAGHATARKFPIWFRDRYKTPTRTYVTDRWKNIKREINSLGNVTDYRFNHRNQLRKRIEPEVSVTEVIDGRVELGSSGESPRKRPVTYYGYNRRGFKVGTRNANGHTHGVILDAAGQWTARILGDGTRRKTRHLDAFGNAVRTIDARRKMWRYEYDKMHRLTSIRSPLGNRNRTYKYNELGRRNYEADCRGRAYRYAYDARGNVSDRYLPAGQRTRIVSDRNGQPVLIENADGTTLSYVRDYFGHVYSQKDLANRITEFELNFKKQVKRQFLKSGEKWQSIKIEKTVKYLPEDLKHEFPIVTFEAKPVASEAQDITNKYEYGLLKEVTDKGIGKKTTYQHDLEARRIESETRALDAENTLLHRLKVHIDELGRDAKVTDERLDSTQFMSAMVSETKFDAISNRINTKVTVDASGYSADTKAVRQEKNCWSTPDAAGRIIVSEGVRADDGTIKIAPGHGLKTEYKDDLRVKETIINAEGKEIVSDINYDDEGTLQSTSSPEVKTEMKSDSGFPDYYHETSKDQDFEIKPIFDENGWKISEATTDGKSVTGTYEVKEMLPIGLPKKEKITDKSGVFDMRENEYFLAQTPSLTQVTAIRTTPGSPPSSESKAAFCQDANGMLNGKINSDDEPNGGKEPPMVHLDRTTERGLTTKSLVMDGAITQTHYFSGMSGELLAGFTSGYADINSVIPRPALMGGMIVDKGHTRDTFPSFIDSSIEHRSDFWGADGAVVWHGTSGSYDHNAFFYSDKKSHKDSDGYVSTFKAPIISKDEYDHLPVRARGAVAYRAIDRNQDPRMYDRTMYRALKLIDRSQAHYMQKYHLDYRKNGKDKDIKREVGGITLHSSIRPIARTKPTDKNAKLNSLGWDDTSIMQQLGPQFYTVNPGDTFRSIAKIYGDTQFAEQIADLNGFSSKTHALKAGTVLLIPQLIATRNKSGVARGDQDFMRVAAGSLSPPLVTPMPPPPPQPAPKKRHSSFWGIALKIIAIAVVCVVAPHIAAAVMPLLPTFMAGSTAFVTGVIAGLGDAAVQAAAIKLGAQQKFSMAEVLETGVSVGIGQVIGTAENATQLATHAAEIGGSVLATQLVEISAGLRSKFDIQAVVTQVAAYVASAKINEVVDTHLGKTDMAIAVKSAANTVSGAVIGNGISGTPIEMQYIAANAMGSMVADKVGTSMQVEKAPASKTASKKPTSHKPDTSDAHTPEIQLHADDPRWSQQLSEMSSRQRLAEHTKVRGEQSHLYDPDAFKRKQAEYTLIAKKQSQSESQTLLHKMASSSLVDGLIQSRQELLDAPSLAFRSIRSGDMMGVAQATAAVALSLPVGPGMVARDGLYAASRIGSAAKLGMFSGRATETTSKVVNAERIANEVEHSVPSGSVGSVRAWTTKARLKTAQLPVEGKIRYVPREGYHPSMPLPRGENGGYIDRFGNEWIKGPSRTQGQSFEWDVQLSRTGSKRLGWASRDEEHLNVSLDGRITHR